ncbi:hypothetical protein LC065_00660 [Halobacillus litoralis]|uniref:hypothetical protein n=1 Tax=Halobacillus litoralis TaxID=45668 RepID=UPI001CFDA375|nr:hypothetical protein [Halobacillus litoralis]WLR47842.1 hypothetical protein LC065_00660 [Halobacillus litoralis]
MEARPVRKQLGLTKYQLFLISAIMVAAFLSVSMITKNFNYTLASLITVVVINLSILLKTVRLQRKRAFKSGL